MKYCRSYGFNCVKCIYDKCIDSRGKYESGLDSDVEIRLYDHKTNKVAYKRLSKLELETILNNIYIKWD